MSSDVLILTDSDDDESSRRLVSLVEFMGLEAVVGGRGTVGCGEWGVDCGLWTVDSGIHRATPDAPKVDGERGYACVLVSADALVACPDFDVSELDAPVLVYGFRPCDEHAALVSQISGGALSGLNAVVDLAEYSVAGDADCDVVGHFSGLRFGITNSLLDSTFVAGSSDIEVNSLVAIDQDGIFVECTGNVYLLGVAGVADVGRLIDRMPSVASLFSSLVCFMMFIRHACSTCCPLPVNPNACVVIDDPLLRPRYGFINYEELLKDMEQHNYAVCVSHVPKNSGMTAKVTAQLFAGHSDRFSVCVHGCDHARGEFSTGDEVVLDKLVATSLNLMEKHEKESGVAWARVMVFPHGLFSVAATRVLKNYGLLGAVVSVDAIACGSNPAGSRDETHHRLAEFLAPVVTAYGGVPLFLRRYPKSIEEFAFDLFLGRPLIITTHHHDFRNGAKVLNKFVDRLNEMEPNLRWTGLAEIAERCIVGGGKAGNGIVDGDGVDDTISATKICYAMRRWLIILRDSMRI